MPSHKWYRAFFWLLLAVLTTGNVWTVLLRSTIPRELEGVVTQPETRFEKYPGVDDVHLIRLSGRLLVIDKPVFEVLKEKDRLSKPRWSRTLTTSRGTLEIQPSRDLKQLPSAMTVVGLVGSVLLVQRRRTRRLPKLR